MLRRRDHGRRPLRRGDEVLIRPYDEIVGTLDADGRYQGLVFMPEMAEFCGRPSHVLGRVERIYLDGRGYVGRLRDTVLLETRCDGSAHGGCQMGCLTLWKEAWLQPRWAASRRMVPSDQAASGRAASGHATLRESTKTTEGYHCQMTELPAAVVRMSRWQVWRYWRDVYCGERTTGQVFRMLALLTFNKARRKLGFHLYGKIVGKAGQTPRIGLDLQPGEIVEVKRPEEIKATLDPVGRNRGLVFTPEMNQFCGGRYRVARRIEKGVIEWTGQMASFHHTVALEGVICSGTTQGCCGRKCYHLWREAWLKRVESPVPAGPRATPASTKTAVAVVS